MLNQVHTLGDATTYVLQKKYLLTYVNPATPRTKYLLTYELCENSAASRPKYLLTYSLTYLLTYLLTRVEDADGFFLRDFFFFLISRAAFDTLERAKHWTAFHVAQTILM